MSPCPRSLPPCSIARIGIHGPLCSLRYSHRPASPLECTHPRGRTLYGILLHWAKSGSFPWIDSVYTYGTWDFEQSLMIHNDMTLFCIQFSVRRLA